MQHMVKGVILSDRSGKCAPGRFMHFTRRAFDGTIRPACGACKAGTFKAHASTWGACHTCPAGRWSLPGARTCGEISAVQAQSIQLAKAKGQPQAATGGGNGGNQGHGADAIRGSVSPVRCPSGYYTTDSYITERDSFEPACALCPLGKFSPLHTFVSSSSGCQQCPHGTTTFIEGAVGSAECVLAVASSDGQLVPSGSASNCPPGTYLKVSSRPDIGFSAEERVEHAGDERRFNGWGWMPGFGKAHTEEQQYSAPSTTAPTATSRCLPCKAGRFGLGGSRHEMCTGPCQAGRFGKGGNTSPLCDGACAAGRRCAAGSTSKQGQHACPAGRYDLPGYSAGYKDRLSENACALTAPLQFRPTRGFQSAPGEMSACLLDKALRVVEVLAALKTCQLYVRSTSLTSRLCSPALPAQLAAEFRLCCAGAEHIVLPASHVARQCETQLAPLLAMLDLEHGVGDAEILAGLANAEHRAALDHTSLWAQDGVKAERLLLPLFRRAVRAAKALWDANHDIGTRKSRALLNMCNVPSRCRTLEAITKFIDKVECSWLNCNAVRMRDAQEAHVATLLSTSRAKGSQSGCAFDWVRLKPACGGCEVSTGLAGCFGLFKRVQPASGAQHTSGHRPAYVLQVPAAVRQRCAQLSSAQVGLWFDPSSLMWVLGGRSRRAPYVLVGLRGTGMDDATAAAPLTPDEVYPTRWKVVTDSAIPLRLMQQHEGSAIPIRGECIFK